MLFGRKINVYMIERRSSWRDMIQNRLGKYSCYATDYGNTVGMQQTMENSSDERDRVNRVWYFLGIQGKMNYYI